MTAPRIITDEELLEQLKVVQSAGHNSTHVEVLLELVVHRLVETSTVFNEHEHPVHGVITESNEYESAGSGHTSTPANSGSFGCDKSQTIGLKPYQYPDDRDV